MTPELVLLEKIPFMQNYLPIFSVNEQLSHNTNDSVIITKKNVYGKNIQNHPVSNIFYEI